MSNARELAELGSAYAAGGINGFKNRIINGAMVIDQRNAGASVTNTTGALFVTDRFSIVGAQSSKFTAQQSTTAPAGFINSLIFTSSSAYTVGSSEDFTLRQSIEGLNCADLGWGAANAQSVTLSFWVRSSLTGTFGGSVSNSASDRFYPFSFTISSANTFEYKTITIAGDTTGTWLKDNGIGIRIIWSLGAGATVSGPAGAWTSSYYRSVTGATSVVGTNGATFYITGVQLEKGSTATSFDYRPYGTEYALCQRYYQTATQNVAFGITSTEAVYIWKSPVTMRARPSMSIGGAGSYSSTSPYYESFPWWTAGTCTGASVSSTHAGVSGGDVLVEGTYSASPARNQVLNLFNQYAPDTLPYNANQSYLIISAEL